MAQDDPTEREKWDAEQKLKIEELRLKDRELDIRKSKSLRAKWSNPLVLAVLGAALAAMANMVATFYSGAQQREMEKIKNAATQELEQAKSEAALVLESIKTGDPEKAATNLRFLAETKLITQPDKTEAILAYVKKGGGVSLPPQGAIARQDKPVWNCSIVGAGLAKVASAIMEEPIPDTISAWSFPLGPDTYVALAYKGPQFVTMTVFADVTNLRDAVVPRLVKTLGPMQDVKIECPSVPYMGTGFLR